jgi:hypothetical protein
LKIPAPPLIYFSSPSLQVLFFFNFCLYTEDGGTTFL